MQHQNGLSDLAYDKIKSLILQNQLKPGQLLKEAQLQDLVGIGRTPVREALLRLADSELVNIHPRKGIEIARVSPKSIRDIFQARSLIEPLVLQTYHENLSLDSLHHFRQQFDQSSADHTLTRDKALALADLDDQFHLAIIEAMGNQYTTQMMKLFADKLTIIRASVSVADNQRWLISNQEHIRIIDAILMENIDSACDLLRSHLAVSYEEAVKTLMQMD